MFKTAWGLQWSPCAYTNMDVTVNPRMTRLDINSLVQSYRSKATYLGNVVPAAAVYVESPPTVDEDSEEEEQTRPWTAPNRSTITFAPSGMGHVGYVGHLSVDEVVRKAVIAMCFRRNSRTLVPPGAGVPPTRVSLLALRYVH